MIMGNTQSDNKSNTHFSKSLHKIDRIISKILTNNDTFLNSNYNVMCDQFTLVLQSQLNKNLKVDLIDLKDSIYLVPTKNFVTFEEKSGKPKIVKKQDLCIMISKHYNRILKIIVMIKYILNIENNGEFSIAGICFKNVKLQDNFMFLTFCEARQKDYKSPDKNIELVDFSQLQGLEKFCNDFLNKEEKNILVRNMKNILDHRNIGYMMKGLSCGDSLFTGKEYADIFSTREKRCDTSLKSKFETALSLNDHDLKMQIGPYNPIISESMCTNKQLYVLPIGKTSANQNEANTLMSLYKKMYSNYDKNIERISNILNLIVTVTKDDVSLKHLDNGELDKIEKQAKNALSKFYLQSISDYQNLLSFAKKAQKVVQK